MSELKYIDLVRYLIKDKEQVGLLRLLADRRGFEVKDLVRRGIFAVPDRDELSYLLEQWGMEFEDVFGLELSEVRLIEGGFIVPVLDSRRRVLFFVNYSWERPKGRQYFNVMPYWLREHGLNMKMYGAHNLSKGIEEGWVVAVEGVFDAIRLESLGIPAVALMGSKLLKYQQYFLRRFDKVIYIPDNDNTGDLGWGNVYRGLDNAIRFNIDGLHKDVDEYYNKDKEGFMEWLEKLKMYKG